MFSRSALKNTGPAIADDGFILVSIIWIAGLFAVIATAFAVDIRVTLLASANTVQIAKAEAIADGLVTLTVWKLATEGETERSIPRNGQPWACDWLSGSKIQISVQDQGGLIDLNAASSALLVRIFEKIGLSASQASKIASAIEDYRDSDSDAAGGGSEPEVYENSRFGPKNAAFQAVEEMTQLPGIDAETYRRLLPLVTVHSLQPGFDPKLLPPYLQRLLGISDNGDMPSELVPFAGPSQGRTFGIDILVVLKNKTAFHRRAIIALLNQPDRLYTVLTWQRAKGGEASVAGQANTKNCFS